jgi:PD-(D/E)XK endonuclease
MIVIGLLAIPALATAKGGGKSIDMVAARACAKERHQIGKPAFRKKYGARATMRACVRRTRGMARNAQNKAVRDCLAGLQANPAEFAEDYGDENGAGAFEECVAEATESQLDPGKLTVVEARHRLKAPEPSSHPVDVGLRTEAAILSELIRRGYEVLVPFGTNQRYDLVLDIEGQFVRVQCKTGRLRRGVVIFSTKSTRSNSRSSFTLSYDGDAEDFLVYCPDTGRIYAVPVDDAPAGYGYSGLIRPATAKLKGFAGLATTSCPPSSIGGAPDL